MQYGQEAYPGGNREVYYKEDVFVGYRHFATNNVKPLFPFGFGLSYTTFAYSKPIATLEGDNIVVQTTITNTGKVAGKEIAQVYSSAPQSDLPRPSKELKGFAKTKLLDPGESETLRIIIPKEELNYYDETKHGWALTTGTYTFHVGANVNEIKGKVEVKVEG